MGKGTRDQKRFGRKRDKGGKQKREERRQVIVLKRKICKDEKRLARKRDNGGKEIREEK